MPNETFINLKEDKKTRIINGLLNVFYELGYDRVTVSDIVKSCDIPRGSFYQYFENKFDAFQVLVETYQTIKLTYFGDLLNKVGKVPFFDLYLDMVEAGLNFAKDYPKLVTMWLAFYHSQDARINALWKTFEDAGVNYIVELLKKDQDAGYTKKDIDLRAVAKILIHAQGVELIQEIELEKPIETIRQNIQHYIDIIQNGIKKEASHE
jgi:AcrR family transcriptional regulator